MMEESKELTQMLLTTMVTNENMKWSFLAPGSTSGAHVGGDLEWQYYGLVETFTMLILMWIMSLLLFLVHWRRKHHHNKPSKKPVKVTFVEQKHEQEHEYHYEHESESISESEDDHSQEEEESPFLPPSPTKSNMDASRMEELPEIMAQYYDVWSPNRRHSLRLALKKHRGLGSGWEDSEHRYSLRVASHYHDHHDM